MAWLIERHGAAVVVTMNSNMVNAQNEQFFLDLHAALDEVEDEHPGCAMVLTGSGTAFSAGLDFTETTPMFARADPAEVSGWWERYRATNLRLFSLPRPTVAAVNGHAVAGGFITAAVCDFRVGVREAKYGLNEVRVGIPMPLDYLELVRHSLGTHGTSYAALSGELFDGDQAYRLGLLHEVVEPSDVVAAALTKVSWLTRETQPAYAASKAAMQALALRNIDALASAAAWTIGALLDDGSQEARERRFQEITGREFKPEQARLDGERDG